ALEPVEDGADLADAAQVRGLVGGLFHLDDQAVRAGVLDVLCGARRGFFLDVACDDREVRGAPVGGVLSRAAVGASTAGATRTTARATAIRTTAGAVRATRGRWRRGA